MKRELPQVFPFFVIFSLFFSSEGNKLGAQVRIHGQNPKVYLQKLACLIHER